MLRAYHKALSRLEAVTGGYAGKMFAADLLGAKNVHGKVRSLGDQTLIERKAIETQMKFMGIEPQPLAKKEIRDLPFTADVGKLPGSPLGLHV